MDDGDSPDELIKHKRMVPWEISDSDDDTDGSEEGESESSDEEGDDDDLEGEGGEDNEEEDDEDEEDGDAKTEDGVFGNTSGAILAMSSDEEADKCPICLNTFNNQPVATPENCEHYFCLDCILAWSKNANSCPVDRITFNSIYLRKSYGGKVQKMITVQKTVTEDNEVTVDMDLEQTNCEVCQSSDREDRLLLCDGCDAGYHMECLTPPLDTVPVEEWFCPECVVNTHNNSGSVEQQNQTQRLPSAVQPTTSRSQSRAAGPTRAIARTRHSERVRANVNQHRITQLAPAEQIQSNWLDETINAVVAGLNTAIYVRDLTSRVPTRRKRKTGTRRKATKKKPLSVKGRKGRSSRPRKKRKLRKSKSTKTLVGKKLATPRSRIANSLGLSKDKNNCSLPTVCRPSEHTLSSMRADIGAASLSIYGDPFDLDPFADRGGSEEDAQEETISSLLEAKRRGISHSAFRSHQPVARPVSAGMSRHGLEVPQARGVVEAAPVPDLLGSILSGQSLLLMDSSDVVISPDGSLTASRSAASLSTLRPILRKRSSSEESCSLARPVVSSSLVECFSSDHLICQDQISSDLPGPPQSNLNRPYSQCSSRVPSGVSRIQPPHYPDLPSRGRSCFQPHPTNRPSPSFGIQSTNGVSMCGASFSTSSSKARLPSQCHAIKAPTKPMWVDVDILPRIPKIKRDATNNSGTDKSNCNSSTGTNNSGMPETALVCFAGNKNREQDVGQQSNTDRQPQNQRAGSSQSSSNSYSISSNTASPSAPLCNSSVSSSSSSSISFRINATSWRSRRLIPLLPSASESSTQGEMTEKTDEAKKREEHREKQKLLAAHTAAGNKKEVNIYDPFNPTLSDTSSSDSEDKSLGSFIHDFNSVSSSASTHDGAQSKQKLLGVKTETHERDIVQEEPKSAHLQTSSRLGSCTSRVVKIKNDSILVDIKTDNHTALSGKSNREPGFADSGKNNVLGHSAKRCSGLETPCPLSLVPHCQDHLKTKEESGKSVISSQKNNNNSTGCGSFLIKVKLKEERDSDARSSPRDFSHDKKTFVPAVPSKEQHSTSSISECYRDKTRGTPVSNQGDREKKMDKDREKRSKSREGRARSSSESSLSSSPISTYKKRRQRSRSSSSSSLSSRECSSRKKHKDSSQERSDTSTSGRERRRVSKDRTHSRFRSRSRSKGRSKNQRRGRSRSKSRSRSPYRSRSKDRRKKHTHSHYDNVKARSKHNRRSLSRSRSRERSKVDGSSKSIPKTSVSLFSSPKYPKDTKNESRVSLSSVKEEKNPEVKENVSSPTIVTEVKREDESTDTMAISIGIKKEIQIIEVKKKRQQPIDMFQDSPTPSHTEKEETPSTIQVLQKEPFEEEMCETTKKDEICEIVPMKAEAFSSELTVMSHHTSGGRQESLNHFQHDVKTQIDQANTIELTVPTEQVPGFDEALCVDMMLDSLDYVTQEHAEDIGVTVKQEDVGIGVKQERKTETELPLTPSKVKVQGKRVTWNIIEPNGGQPDKSVSKLSLCKQTLKKEAACLPSSITTRQDTSGPESVNDSANKDMGTVPTGSGCQAYLKKLHMQERAIEEVKLAIKPFYQKRDINKEEYKEILRKAVQKVCHSKSGEINPVKVGNLVKAYVDKYKHARKHRKSETKPTKTADGP